MKKKLTVLALICVLMLNITSPALAAREQPSSWASEDVNTTISLGLVPKDLQSEYTQPITRSEFCSLVLQLAEVLYEGNLETALSGHTLNYQAFTDTDDYAVLFCEALGIVSGDGNGHFLPHASITREETAMILYNTAECFTGLNASDDSGTVSPESFPHIFSDGASIQSWARDKIYWVYHEGIMKGTSNDSFNPDGNFTREQCYVTIQRLYYLLTDPAKVEKPDPEYYPYGDGYIDSTGKTYTKQEKGYFYPFDRKYASVADDPNSLRTTYHIVDWTGATLLSDFKETGGHFSGTSINGNLAFLIFNGAATTYVVNLKTGAVYENAQLGDRYDGMIVYSIDQKYGYFDEDGNPVINPQYKDAGSFYDGKAAVQNQNGSWDIIDEKGKVIKSNFLDTKKYEILSNLENQMGEFVIVQNSEDKCAVYKGTSGWLTGFDYDSIRCCQKGNTSCCQNGQFIAHIADSGYVLLNSHGKQISRVYHDELRMIDLNCYAIHSEGNEYSFIMINEDGKEIFSSSIYSSGICSDGNGLFLVAKDSTSCIIIDSRGETVGTIERKYAIGDYGFVNGLVYITDSGKHPEGTSPDPYYYLPDGSSAFSK